MKRILPVLLFYAAATAAGTARANATWRPEEPLALWRDAPVAEAAANARTNALGAAFCADTGLVPAPGPFTASALLRVDGLAPMPETMEWRNGMALCCGSGYYDGFRLEGCGAHALQCSFEELPSSAIRLEGNDHVVAGCGFRRCVLESDDQGAIDTWGDPTYRGSVIAFNLFEDVGADGMHACGRAAVRLDDLISGTEIYGNLFRRAARGNFGAVQVHGGQHNRIFANVFEDCALAMSFDPWGAERRLAKLAEPEFRDKCAGRADDPAWLRRYPELAHLRDEPDRNLAAGNLFVRCGRPYRRKTALLRAFWNRDAD